MALNVPENFELIENIFRSGVMDWNKFTAIANNHLVLQMLYPELNQYDLLKFLPKDLQTHLNDVYKLNTIRNNKILGQISRISELFYKNNITAIFLKGAGILLDDIYKDPGKRIMEDVDILIPQEDWKKAVNQLISNNYVGRSIPDETYISKIKHYPRLSNTSEPAEVEIHQTAVNAKYSDKFSFDLLHKNSVPSLRNKQVLVLNDQYKIIHSALHAMKEHKGFITTHIRLREIKEIETLSKKVKPKDIFYQYPWFHKEISSLYKLTELVFHLPSDINIPTTASTSFFLFRRGLNLNNKALLYLNLFLLRFPKKVFNHYFKVPFLAILTKKERKRFLKKILKSETWRKHYKSYGEIFR